MVTIKKILGQIRRAIEDYDMIQDGDKIAVGVSGGKDSMTLLVELSKLRNFYPKKFDIEAITLTMGIGEFDVTPIQNLCNSLGVHYTCEETLIGKIIFEARKESNPCSLCANMRRGALNNLAVSLGCNKIAFAHNKDDVIETLLLSMFYEGRIHNFSPVTYLERKNIHLIRPLIYTEEKDIKGFIKKYNIPIVKNPCPANGKTKRQYIKNLISDLFHENHNIKNNIFGALKRSGIDGW